MGEQSVQIVIIGAGPMACEYAKVLSSLQISFDVVGRGEESAKAFYDTTGIKAGQDKDR